MTTPELPPLHWVGAMQIDNASFQSLATEASVEARERILLARIAELEREAEYWKMDGVHTCHDECPRVACVQRRRIAELEADAGRYRWLRDKSPGHWMLQVGDLPLFKGDIDAAIDAARGKE